MAGVPSKSGLNSTTERTLVWWLAKGYGMDDAARRAGIPSTAALYRYKRTVAFADDLRAALRDRLGTELAPKAIRILDEIMSDQATPARVRVDAAKTLLDRCGFVAVAGAPPEHPDRDLRTYTAAELSVLMTEAKRNLAAMRGEAVEGEPSAAELSAVALDGQDPRVTDPGAIDEQEPRGSEVDILELFF